MKKIDKSNILSKEYEKLLKFFTNKNHPKYNSSKCKYYNDIKMSLLYCQNGLCAYTEKFLCDSKFITVDNWDKKRYKTKLDKTIKGDLEHFDESLKDKKGWLWDNLFVVDTHINCRIKSTKPIKSILKPDSSDYDPNKYLNFDFETGVFFPIITLTKKEKEDVKYMIETLGLNCYSYERKEYLKLIKDLYPLREPKQYITAWNMTLNQLKQKGEL